MFHRYTVTYHHVRTPSISRSRTVTATNIRTATSFALIDSGNELVVVDNVRQVP